MCEQGRRGGASADALIAIFDACFARSHNTRLVRGDREPLYLPADANCDYHRVIFAHGFAASALHEIAHWCIAGSTRRQLVDYGYWYEPDGRSAAQQQEFERVEARPQALEWIFSRAAGLPFRVSVDNLNGQSTDPLPFKRAVIAAARSYCARGLPPRAAHFHRALAGHFGTVVRLQPDDFFLEQL